MTDSDDVVQVELRLHITSFMFPERITLWAVAMHFSCTVMTALEVKHG